MIKATALKVTIETLTTAFASVYNRHDYASYLSDRGASYKSSAASNN
jgi:hypothetical protein